MSSGYRRAIRLHALARQATAEIEDDFHHFVVTVLHDGVRVTDARGQAIRYPWSSCPLAAGSLAALAGLPISSDPTAVYRHIDPLLQCTHMFEMAGLAVTQAARGPGVRRYEAAVSDPVEGCVEAELACDGAPVLGWRLQGGVIAEPARHRGKRPADFRSQTLADLPHEEAEHLLILRRAVALAGARGMDIDRFATAADMGRGRACFVFRPGIAEHAVRRRGSVRDFSNGPGPLAAPPAWEQGHDRPIR
jgi:hypothetical protein